MNMKELLELQAKLAEEDNKLAKQDRLLQMAQVYQEREVKKDSDIEITQLTEIAEVGGKQVKVLKEISEKLEISKSSNNVKQTEKLNETLKDLKEVIKQNIKLSMIQGGGEKVAKGIQAANAQPTNATRLKSMLFGEHTKEDVEKNSWTRKLGIKNTPTMALYNWANKREEKRAYENEKNAYVNNALRHDPNTYRTANFHGGMGTQAGKDAATKKAESDFKKIKEKEAELLAAQKRIDDAKAAGYDPLAKDTKARNTIASELTELDPRRKKEFATVNGKPIPLATEKSEDQVETESAAATASKSLLSTESAMGSSLIQSLDIQKQQLETLKAILVGIGGLEAGGGSLLGDAASMAGGLGKKALGMGAKAAGFLGKHAGKIGAIGGIAMGAYDAYTGWGEANDQYEAGQITKNEADIKKSEAVGGGVGGAAGAWGGAAAGAAIGSVVPVVGTAIGGVVGGALGYMGGSAIGSKVGGALTSGYKGVKSFLGFGNPEDDKLKQPEVVTKSGEFESIEGTVVEKGKPLTAKQMATVETNLQHGIKQSPLVMEAYNLTKKQGVAANVEAPTLQEPAVVEGSKNNENIKAEKLGASNNNTIINAPNNSVTNTGGGMDASAMRSPIRNPESTVGKYIDSKFAT